MNLYDQNPSAWQSIREQGRPNLAKMARMVFANSEMEQALGYGTSVVCKWVSGENKPSLESERRAGAWLRVQKQSFDPVAPEVAPAAATMLLIVCPDGVSAKIERIAAMLGCEVTEV